MEKKSVFKGYFYGCISAISYGMIPLFTLPLMQEGMTYPSILFYRYVFGFLSLLALMLLKRDSFKLYWREVPVLLVMAILFALSSIYLFKSYTYMAAGIASTILFMYPIFVAVIMSLFYKEKINSLISEQTDKGLCNIRIFKSTNRVDYCFIIKLDFFFYLIL